MKKITALLLGVLLFGFQPATKLAAQSVQILSSNAVNGAINGVVLGGASMFLTDKKVNAPFNKNLEDLYALQVGLGLGTLYGVGMGAYDVVTGEGRQILVSGFFNDGNNSSIIVLMDTFYGAAAGGLISLSLSLVSNEPVIDSMQYGIGIGAFVGFGFGIFDTFVIANRSSESVAMNTFVPETAEGIASISFENGASFGLINPTILNQVELSNSSFGVSLNPAVEVINFRINF